MKVQWNTNYIQTRLATHKYIITSVKSLNCGEYLKIEYTFPRVTFSPKSVLNAHNDF